MKFDRVIQLTKAQNKPDPVTIHNSSTTV